MPENRRRTYTLSDLLGGNFTWTDSTGWYPASSSGANSAPPQPTQIYPRPGHAEQQASLVERMRQLYAERMRREGEGVMPVASQTQVEWMTDGYSYARRALRYSGLDASNALTRAFAWRSTAQGPRFWEDVSQRLRDNSESYLSLEERLLIQHMLREADERIVDPVEPPSRLLNVSRMATGLSLHSHAGDMEAINNALPWTGTGAALVMEREFRRLQRETHARISPANRHLLEAWLQWDFERSGIAPEPTPSVSPSAVRPINPEGVVMDVAALRQVALGRAIGTRHVRADYINNALIGADYINNALNWSRARERTGIDWEAAHDRVLGGGALTPTEMHWVGSWLAWYDGQANPVEDDEEPAPAVVEAIAREAWVEPPFEAHEAHELSRYLNLLKAEIRDGHRLPQHILCYPGGPGFAECDTSAAAEKLRQADWRWPMVQIRRRNGARTHSGFTRATLVVPVIQPPKDIAVATELPRLKRMPVAKIKAKLPAINGATAGCDCDDCVRRRGDVRKAQNALTVVSADMRERRREFAAHGRTFGVEIECFIPTRLVERFYSGCQFTATQNYLRSKDVTCHTRQFAGETHWGIKHDGSLGHMRAAQGVEIVSPILRGEAGLANVRKTATALVEGKFKVNVQCGLHVHMGAGDLTVLQKRNIVGQFIRYERFFDLILPVSRRSTRYAKSLRSGMAPPSANPDKAAQHAILKLLECDTPDQFTAYAGRMLGDHHARLSFNAHGTLEFRQHSGTINPDKIENWVRLILAFTEGAKDKAPLPFYSRPLEPEEEMERFFKLFSVPTDVRQYYRERHKALYANPEDDS